MRSRTLPRGGWWRRARPGVVALASAVAAACASVAPTLTPGDVAALSDAAFTAQGRLSARHGNDAVSASFRWMHAPPKDELELGTPLGQTVAQLTGDASVPYARVQLADGRSLEAADWAALTERALGFPLPVAGLAAWIRGGPHAGSSYASEVDQHNRVALLRQDGWEVLFDYADSAATPSRLRLTYPGVEVRIAIEHVE